MMVNDDQKFIIRHLSMQRSMQSKHTSVYESVIRELLCGEGKHFIHGSLHKTRILCTKFYHQWKGCIAFTQRSYGRNWLRCMNVKRVLKQNIDTEIKIHTARENVESMVVESHSKLLSSFVQVKLIINNQNNVHHSTIPVCSSELNEQCALCCRREKY